METSRSVMLSSGIILNIHYINQKYKWKSYHLFKCLICRLECCTDLNQLAHPSPWINWLTPVQPPCESLMHFSSPHYLEFWNEQMLEMWFFLKKYIYSNYISLKLIVCFYWKVELIWAWLVRCVISALSINRIWGSSGHIQYLDSILPWCLDVIFSFGSMWSDDFILSSSNSNDP